MEKLPPEKAAEMLRKKGIEVSVEQAALMLALLRMLAGIIVATYLEQGRYPWEVEHFPNKTAWNIRISGCFLARF